MTARRIMWPVTILMVLAVVALAVPGSPFYLSDVLATGWHYKGRPTSYWMKALDSQDPEERTEAIYALGSIHPPVEEAVPVLAALMIDSPQGETRSQAALALSKMAPVSRQAVPAFAKALSDDDLWVRMNAALALSRLKEDSKPAIPALVQALNDKANNTNLAYFSVTIQQVAVLALGRSCRGNAEGLAAIAGALGKEFPDDLRLSAMQALAEIGPEARGTVPKIREFLNHPHKEMRDAAAEALQQIGS